MDDKERLDWLEREARRSPTGISFDWIPSVEGESSGFRFMRRHFIGGAKRNLRDAIDAAIIEKAIRESTDPRDPDFTRSGIFIHHNCSRCFNGTNLSRCPTPNAPGNCGYPQARND